MSDNIIYNSYDNTHIGYYKDLTAYIENCLDDYKESKAWESVKDMADLLLDLHKWADNPNLLVLSDGNGMGYMIEEYKIDKK